MTDNPDTRVWLLPNFDVVTVAGDPKVGFWIAHGDGEGISSSAELPEGAVPLVALPVPAIRVDDDGDYIEADTGLLVLSRATTRAPGRDRLDSMREWHFQHLANVLEALRLAAAERERESLVEAARRKVLADFEPGMYDLDPASGANRTAAVVTVDGRLLVYTMDGTLEDRAEIYASGVEWKFTQLTTRDLSPVVTDA